MVAATTSHSNHAQNTTCMNTAMHTGFWEPYRHLELFSPHLKRFPPFFLHWVPLYMSIYQCLKVWDDGFVYKILLIDLLRPWEHLWCTTRSKYLCLEWRIAQQTCAVAGSVGPYIILMWPIWYPQNQFLWTVDELSDLFWILPREDSIPAIRRMY